MKYLRHKPSGRVYPYSGVKTHTDGRKYYPLEIFRGEIGGFSPDSVEERETKSLWEAVKIKVNFIKRIWS